jgi:hypothetical protein
VEYSIFKLSKVRIIERIKEDKKVAGIGKSDAIPKGF